MCWFPELNNKFADNFFKGLSEFRDDYGYIPNLREYIIAMSTTELKEIVIKPDIINIFKTFIILKKGFQSEINHGFTHYMIFDRFFKDFNDFLEPAGLSI